MTLTNTQRIVNLEAWQTAHKAEHAKGVIHSHPAPVPAIATPTALPYTFFDDFVGASLDLSKWGYGPTGHYHVPASSTSILYDPENIVVGPNGLELKARRQADGTWHGALIDTQAPGQFKQLYGWFGVSAKVTQGKGLFPAPLWLYGQGQEMDICEILANVPGTNPKPGAYAEWPYADDTLAHFHLGRVQPLAAYRYHLPAGTFADGFHSFEVDWRADHVTWYVDGIERAKVTNAAIIPNVAMALVIDHAAGGTWASEPDTTTPSPASLFIDKVWAKP